MTGLFEAKVDRSLFLLLCHMIRDLALCLKYGITIYVAVPPPPTILGVSLAGVVLSFHVIKNYQAGSGMRTNVCHYVFPAVGRPGSGRPGSLVKLRA